MFVRRLLVLGYGVVCYSLFLATFLYAIGFIGGWLTPTRLSAAAFFGERDSLGTALGIDLALLGAFALQHSVMARAGFKRWFQRWLPAPIERSTYVLATNAVLGLLFWQWRPFGGEIWRIEAPVGRVLLWSLFVGGWAIVFVTSCLIHHFDLFGLRQAWLYFRQQPYVALPFVTPGPYRYVRHPLYVGWLLVFWGTPTMTTPHLVFALAMTVYIVVAIRFEERDLQAFHPGYADYQRRTPMLIPNWPLQRERESRRALVERS